MSDNSSTIDRFFGDPILNSPYEYSQQHWELDLQGQPTQRIVDGRRRAEFVTPIPKPKKQKGVDAQRALLFDAISTERQQYDPTSNINAIRQRVDEWRLRSNPADWRVSPETARLLQHWRHYEFSGISPFFCQIEAVETLIWLTEVAPHESTRYKGILEWIDNANAADSQF